MKNMVTRFFFICVIFLLPAAALAQSPSVPHFLNYQSLLYDDGGNLIENGPADITFKISDVLGNVLYEEHQTVDVVNGAVSALVGNGLNASGAPIGGIPFSIFTPDGPRYLDVTVDSFPPESGLEIVSVPYAIYAEKALGAADESITSAALAKKSITMEHFADGLIADLANQMSTGGLIATRTDLTNLQTTYRGTTGASTIGVTSGFVYSGSNNLQGVLQDLDRAVQHRQAGIEAVQTNITNETNARISADTTLQTNINAEASARAGADSSHASTSISSAHPNGSFPILRLDTDVATQGELDSEISARSGADAAEAAARAAADAVEAAARDAKDREHDMQISAILGSGDLHPNVWGTVTCAGLSPTMSGENATVSIEGRIGVCRITFDEVKTSTNYAIIATSMDTSNDFVISNKTTDGLTVTFAISGLFDFIVIGS